MFRRDRGTIGGGLVIYVKDFYHCTRRSDLESISLECICLEIKQQYLKPLLLCYCCRPPSCDVSWLSDFSVLSKKNVHALLKKKRVKKCQQPGWMNQEILNSIKTRDKFHNETNLNNYKIWKNKVKSLIFKSKQEFFNDAINSNAKNPKKTMGRYA